MKQLDRRSFSVALAAAVGAFAVAAKPSPAPREVLFVCQFGTVKSAIARELLKRRSSARNVTLLVSSRGITPQDHLPDNLRHRLIAEGIDPEIEPVRKLRQADLDAADVVVLFDHLPPGLVAPKARDWSDVPSMLARYPEARADLDQRIDTLLDQLAR